MIGAGEREGKNKRERERESNQERQKRVMSDFEIFNILSITEMFTPRLLIIKSFYSKNIFSILNNYFLILVLAQGCYFAVSRIHRQYRHNMQNFEACDKSSDNQSAALSLKAVKKMSLSLKFSIKVSTF